MKHNKMIKKSNIWIIGILVFISLGLTVSVPVNAEDLGISLDLIRSLVAETMSDSQSQQSQQSPISIVEDETDLTSEELSCNNDQSKCHTEGWNGGGAGKEVEPVTFGSETIKCYINNQEDHECKGTDENPTPCVCYRMRSYGECISGTRACEMEAKYMDGNNNEQVGPCKCGNGYTTEDKPFCLAIADQIFSIKYECDGYSNTADLCDETNCAQPSSPLCEGKPCSGGAGTCTNSDQGIVCQADAGEVACNTLAQGRAKLIKVDDLSFRNQVKNDTSGSNIPGGYRCYDGDHAAGTSIWRFPNTAELRGHKWNLDGEEKEIDWERFQREYLGVTNSYSGQGSEEFRRLVNGREYARNYQCCVLVSSADYSLWGGFFGPIDPRAQWVWDKTGLAEIYGDKVNEFFGLDNWSLGAMENMTDWTDMLCDSVRVSGEIVEEPETSQIEEGGIVYSAQGTRGEWLPDYTRLYEVSWSLLNERGSDKDINVSVYLKEEGQNCENSEETPVSCKKAAKWEGDDIIRKLVAEGEYIYGYYSFYYNQSVNFTKTCVTYTGDGGNCNFPMVDETYDAPDPAFSEGEENTGDSEVDEGGWV